MAASEDVVDGQVVGEVFTPQQAAAASGRTWVGSYQTDEVSIDSVANVAVGAHARAAALFLKLPFFAYVALNGRMPPLVRLGAAVLGVWEAMEIASRQQEIEEMIP
jgi:hypothetical protein